MRKKRRVQIRNRKREVLIRNKKREVPIKIEKRVRKIRINALSDDDKILLDSKTANKTFF
jgi:hypothetical protein